MALLIDGYGKETYYPSARSKRDIRGPRGDIGNTGMPYDVAEIVKRGAMKETGRLKEKSEMRNRKWFTTMPISDEIRAIVESHVDACDTQRPATGPKQKTVHFEIRTAEAEKRLREMVTKLSEHAVVTIDCCIGYRYSELIICDLTSEWCFDDEGNSLQWKDASRAHVIYLELEDTINDNASYVLGFHVCSDSVKEGKTVIANIKPHINELISEVDGVVNGFMRREASVFVRQARARIAGRKGNKYDVRMV